MYHPNTSQMPTAVPTPVYPPVYSPYLPNTILYYLHAYHPSQNNPSASPPFNSSIGDLHAHANLIATPSQQPDKAWYRDSGATNHFTHGPPTSNHVQPYVGSCKVQVANGTFFDINNIGASVINTTYKPLVLHNLLYMPNITKNLVYVSQFNNDNLVFVEFHPKCCLIRDAGTKEVLRTSVESGGLYKIDFSTMNDRSNNRLVSCNNSVSLDNQGSKSCFSGQLKVFSYVLH